MNNNKLPDVPFNIFTATEDEIDKEAGRRFREKQKVEQELKKFRQHYSNDTAQNCPEDAIDSPIGYARLKTYYDELNTSITYQEMLVAQLKKMEAVAEKLSGFDILQQIENVLRLRIPCPDWLYQEFHKRFACVAEGDAKGFGDKISFGKHDAGNAGSKQSRVKDYTGESYQIFYAAEMLIEKGVPTADNNDTSGVFEQIGQKFGISASTARKIYDRVKKECPLIDNLINHAGSR